MSQTPSPFKQRQAKIIAEASKERKEQEKARRQAQERAWYKDISWYDQDNAANSPLEADWDEEDSDKDPR